MRLVFTSEDIRKDDILHEKKNQCVHILRTS